MNAEIEALPLSPAQRRLWLVQRLDPGSAAYNIALGLRLRGELDVHRLRRALEIVVARHEALRTTFEIFETEPVQVFHESIDLPWEEIDLAGFVETERAERVAAIEHEEATRPFDLARGPLVRSRLVRLASADHLCFLTFHHVVFDGWSQEVLLDELSWLYRELPAGEEAASVSAADFPELPIQYADFAAWQEEQLTEERLEKLVAFWRRELAGYPTILRLPTDRPRPPRQTFVGDVVESNLPREVVERLEALGEREGATPFMAFLAVWLAVVHRLTGESRVLVASPTAGRSHPDTERLIGNFVNTVIFRGDATGGPSFAEYLRRVRDVATAAVAHEQLMFDQVVDAVEPERHPSYSPLAQVGFSVDSFAQTERELAAGVVLEPSDPAIKSSKSDLTLMVKRSPAGARLLLEYNSDLFDRTTAERWLGYAARAAAAVVEAPETPVRELPIVGPEERRRLLEEWPFPETDADPAHWETSVPAAFAACAETAPDAVAVEGDGLSLTYGEVDRRSAALARRLRRSGVGRGDLVALSLDRSPELIVALLAVLRSGAGYVPVDPAYPEERRRLMIEDSGARLLVVRSGMAETAPLSIETVQIGEPDLDDAGEAAGPEGPPVGAGDLAYVIYTSGSTGRPKGVAVLHRGIARLVLGTDFTIMGPSEAMLHLASISFDAATFEVWGPLLTGGRIVLFSGSAPSPAAVRGAVARHRATRLFLTTALFDQLAGEPEAIPTDLGHVLSGGEQASPASYRALLSARPALALTNLYGPTENTSITSHQPVRDPESVGESVPIGRAIVGNACFVLDHDLRPAPTGVDGELLVGGPGLALGYLGRPAATAERFVPHPFASAPGERLYRTGDLVRWLSSGRLEFRGRNDFQVKIRGFRIEPGEVEAVLDAAPGVERAVVVVRPVAGDPALVGYWVPEAGAEVGAEALRDHLRKRLPSFMVPAALVEMEELPIAAGGKIDRSALPDPDRSVAAAGAESVAPRTPLEEEIAALWSEVLRVERVGIHDDFFALGGHSLLATRILARLADDFGVEVPLADLFGAPTVAGLATALGTLMLDEMEDLEEIEDVS